MKSNQGGDKSRIMSLGDLLSEKRESILDKWFDLILNTYHPDTAKFLKNQKNQFTNPVGSTIYTSMERLLDELVSDKLDRDRIISLLDDIIRIRAIQGFTPSQSLSFIPALKDIVREEISDNSNAGLSEEMLAFERRLDTIIMSSFDVYMECRERLYEIKSNEIRNMTAKLVERANHIFEMYNQNKKTALQDNN